MTADQPIPQEAVEPFDILGKQDARPKRGLWAPGSYCCTCRKCSARFTGDKRAFWCADCAYAEPEAAAIPHLARPAEDATPDWAEAFNAFDQAAQEWGWQADQGTHNVISSEERYEATKAKLLVAITTLSAERDEARRQRDIAVKDLNETFVDESGLAWSRPTAWAYHAVCKVRDAYQARHSNLSERAIKAEAERDALAARLRALPTAEQIAEIAYHQWIEAADPALHPVDDLALISPADHDGVMRIGEAVASYFAEKEPQP